MTLSDSQPFILPDPAQHGGGDAGFSHTDWSMVYQAADGVKGGPSDGLERLITRYWPAAYAFIRKCGKDVHEAADLTQGFVCDVVLGRRLLHLADPERGRFRSLLMESLKNYVHEQHRHNSRLKRAKDGSQPILIGAADLAAVNVDGASSPESAFSSQWSETMIRQVIDRVRRQCFDDGLEEHWLVFELRVIRPMMFGGRPTEYRDLVQQFDLKDTAQASNMMVTVKRRFARALVDAVAETVSDPIQINDELRSLLSDLEQVNGD